MALDPFLDSHWVVRDQISCSGVTRNLYAHGQALVVICLVESKGCLWRYANAIERHDTENERARRIANAINDDAFIVIADFCEFRLVLLDKPAVIPGDLVIGQRRTRTRQCKQNSNKTTQQKRPPRTLTLQR